MMRRIQTSRLERGKEKSPNFKKKNGGNIEEYLVRAGKINESTIAWRQWEFWFERRANRFYQGLI
jgi:hypothetical protein